MTHAAPPRTVSVIIPLHDHAHTVLAAVESALQQRNLPDDVRIEVTVVDDASTDGGADLLDPNTVTVIRQPSRRGAAAARNLGVTHSTGEFLVFLDSDDLLAPNRIANQLAVLAESPDLDAVSGQIEEFADEGYVPPRAPRTATPTLMAGVLMMRRAAFESVGGFNEQIESREVVEWGARLQRSGATIAQLHEVVLLRRFHAKNHGLDGTHSADLLRAVRQHVLARKPSDDSPRPG